MYDTKFKCRYYRDDVFLETDNISDIEKNIIRDILYKEDILNIFYIDYEDDFNVFSNIISELYDKIKGCQSLRNIMKKMAESVISEDEQVGLSILYSYDYMYITHKCVSEYLDTGSISQKNIDLLNSIIK
jgi:hypothetical protein